MLSLGIFISLFSVLKIKRAAVGAVASYPAMHPGICTLTN
uniref:Uncharacterized protein n=1 Tax=Siphoviridae sp. ct7yc1 TaxID=2827788 RepID=A0A8S5TIM9_9CAUD|nr:MAG TPA: hypothetical protein [Siphoviridae sp. ct7yc1]